MSESSLTHGGGLTGWSEESTERKGKEIIQKRDSSALMKRVNNASQNKIMCYNIIFNIQDCLWN